MFEVYKISSGKGCNRRCWVHVNIIYIAFPFHKKWGTYFKLPMIFFRNSIFCQLIDAHSIFLWHKTLACCVDCFVPLMGILAFRQARNFIVLSKDSKTQIFQIFFVRVLLFFQFSLCVLHNDINVFYIYLFFKKHYVVEMAIIHETIYNI
jgi:hypothetical protein